MIYILIAGTRNYTHYETFCKKITDFLERKNISNNDIIIVEGGASGVDALAKRYALEHRIKYKEYKADWNKYGKAAGPIRNQQMVDIIKENNGMSIFIWDGKSRGTQDCIKRATEARILKEIIIV